jgi:signal transduction histidine kinase
VDESTDTKAAPPVRDAAHPLLLWHSLLLGERLHLFARLRLAVALGILFGAPFAAYVVGIQDLPVPALMTCATLLGLFDLAVFQVVRPYRSPEQAAAGYRLLSRIAHVTILVDYVVLTCAIWLVGGSESPFLAFYLLHAMVASVLLTRRAAFAHALVGYLLLAGIVVGEWRGILPKHRPVGAVPGGPENDVRVVLTVLFVYGLLTAVATYLMTGIAERLRDGERRLREASEDLEKLADLRRSFLHVALHDLRSPVDTVVTLLDNLMAGVGGPLNERQTASVGRADARLRGLLLLLSDLQVLASLESGRIEQVMEPLDVVALVRQTVDDYREPAEERGLCLVAELPEKLPAGRGVRRLLREAVANYLTNAIKYARSGGTIVVRATSTGPFFRIEVSDDGPGISESDQDALFREFARLKPGRGQPSVPGTGLGLSIVRRIAEAHGGRAGVESGAGRGSTFFVEIPHDPGTVR